MTTKRDTLALGVLALFSAPLILLAMFAAVLFFGISVFAWCLI